MLLNDRADVLIGTAAIYNSEIRKRNIKNVIKLEKPISKIEIHIILNKKNKGIVQKLNKILKIMDEEKVIKNIIEE